MRLYVDDTSPAHLFPNDGRGHPPATRRAEFVVLGFPGECRPGALMAPKAVASGEQRRCIVEFVVYLGHDDEIHTGLRKRHVGWFHQPGAEIVEPLRGGRFVDQAALSGLLNSLYGFHLPLLSVDCLDVELPVNR